MALERTKRYTPTTQEVLEDDLGLWLLCKSCGRLSKRVHPGNRCPHCPSKRTYLVDLNIVEELNKEEGRNV